MGDGVRGLTRRDAMRGAAVGAAVVGAGGLLAACGSDGASSGATASGDTTAAAGGTPRSGGTLRVGGTGGGARDSLDPNRQQTALDFARCFALYDPLVELTERFTYELALAEEITPDDSSAKVWTVRLKDGIEFHNGKTADADDLIFSIGRVIDPRAPGAGANALRGVTLNGMRKLDARTVRFTLEQPISIFDKRVGGYLSPLLPVGYDPARPVGAGPFKLQSFKAGDRSVMVPHPNYWGERAHVDQLDIIGIADASAAVNSLLSGQIDILQGLPSAQAKVVTSGGAKLLETNDSACFMFGMRMDMAPFDDVRVRQAMRLIADRDQMVEQVMAGRGEAANDLFARYDPAYLSEVPQRVQDLEQARALLKQAGQDDMRLEISTTGAYPGLLEGAQVFAEQAKGANLDVEVRSVDPDTFYARYYRRTPFSPDLVSPQLYLTVATSYNTPGGPYDTVYNRDPEYLGLYRDALAELDEGKRGELIKAMQRIDHERGGYLCWGFSKSLDAYRDNVNGLVPETKAAFSVNNGAFNRLWLS